MSDQLRAAQLTAQARFTADRQKLDEDLSLPFAATTEQRIASAKRRQAYKLPEVVETSEEMAAKLAEREREFEAQVEALRNPPIEQRFARIVGADYAGCRLDNFRIEPDWPVEARKAATDVLARLNGISGKVVEAVRSGIGIVLCGAPGVGKDHLQAGVLWAALNAKLSCKWVNGERFAALSLDQFNDATKRPAREWLKDWTDPDVLAISDPDGNKTQGPSEHVIDSLYGVVDARQREGKPTWVTINGHDQKVWVARLSARTWDRLLHKVWLLHCNWPGSRKPRGVV